MVIDYGYLIYGNVNSSSYGIYISGEGTYDAPERAVEFVNVPGRNGAIALDQGRFDNIKVTYPAMVLEDDQEDFRDRLSAFRNAIISQKGYQRLEDSYHPYEYRMGVYCTGLNVKDLLTYHQGGNFELSFECKPQRWLKSGETFTTVTSGGSITNPTLFEASPLLKTQGYGMINFNGFSIGLINEPMGIIELPQISIRRENTGAGISDVADLSQCRLNTGDHITLNKEFAWFRNTLYFIPTDSVTDLAYSSLSANLDASRTGVSYWGNSDGTSYIEFRSSPASNIVFTKGTTSSLEYSAVVTFNVGSTSHSFTERLTFYYDGNYEITIGLWLNQTSAGTLNITQRIFEFSEQKWYADSTYPTWHQGLDYVVIDCDLGEAYSVDGTDYVSLNKWVNFGSDLPTLAPGQNSVTFDNTVTSLQVQPRWWKV